MLAAVMSAIWSAGESRSEISEESVSTEVALHPPSPERVRIQRVGAARGEKQVASVQSHESGSKSPESRVRIKS